jgi:outer membrane protein assembly factor BamB
MRVVFMLAVMTTGCFAQNWPQFRGSNASGVGSGSTPVTWDIEKGYNVRWKTPIPGIAVSSPIVWGEKVFITTAVSSDPKASFRHGAYGDVEPSNDLSNHTWMVYALDKKTGKILWERRAHQGVPKTKRHPKSSQASCTPVTDGNVVVAHFGSEGLYAFDTNGNLLWRVDLGILNAGWFFDPDYEWGVASSPIIYKGMVIVQVDIQKESYVAAFRLKDGKQVWKTMRDELPSWPTPTIFENGTRTDLVTHATKAIRGYDPMTGKQLWQLTGNSEVTTPTPIVANGLVYITNGYRGIQPIYAVKPGANGDITLKEGQETNEKIAWSKKRGGPYTPTPLILGELMYIVNNQGIVTVLESVTGKQVYQQRLGTGGSYSASPVAVDGKVYVWSEDGDVYVIKAGPKFEQIGKNQMGEVIMATPAISDGTIIVRGMKHVFGIAAPDPRP